jgi:hypothetical protein
VHGYFLCLFKEWKMKTFHQQGFVVWANQFRQQFGKQPDFLLAEANVYIKVGALTGAE